MKGKEIRQRGIISATEPAVTEDLCVRHWARYYEHEDEEHSYEPFLHLQAGKVNTKWL